MRNHRRNTSEGRLIVEADGRKISAAVYLHRELEVREQKVDIGVRRRQPLRGARCSASQMMSS